MTNAAATESATVRAPAGERIEQVSFIAPVGVGVYFAAKANALAYLRVECCDAIPPQSDVTGFWAVLDEVQ